jgi:Phytochelatin synthase
MHRLPFALVALGLLLAPIARVTAETLPLPDDLIALQSRDGEALLFGAEARADYTPLSLHFVTQQNPAYCGPATIAMVLNALEIPRPPSDLTLGLGLFDQDNIFNARAEAAKPSAEVMKAGMTLDELGAVLSAYDLAVTVHHAEETSLDAFRELAVAELDHRDRFVLVNYLRSAIGQERGGHISPLAAYDAESDRFLILDVSRYKYPPIWVEAAVLFDAMNTPDADNQNRSRGFVVVGR